MLRLVYRGAALLTGLLLVILGIVGLFLPFLQGFLLIASGLSLMSCGSERVARRVRSLKTYLAATWTRFRSGTGSSTEEQ